MKTHVSPRGACVPYSGHGLAGHGESALASAASAAMRARAREAVIVVLSGAAGANWGHKKRVTVPTTSASFKQDLWLDFLEMRVLLCVPILAAGFVPRGPIPSLARRRAAALAAEPGAVYPRTAPARLPPPLVSDEPGTWAHDTMSRRVREDILARVYSENAGAAALEAARPALDALEAELEAAATTPLAPLADDGGADVATWNAFLAPFVEAKATWLSAPWLVTEFYLYRRIVAAFDFWRTKYDPFAKQKRDGLDSAAGSIEALAARTNAACAPAAAGDVGADDAAAFDRLFVQVSLWGNRMDLSIWPAGENAASSAAGADAFGAVLAAGEANLLADGTDALLARVLAPARARGGAARVDIVVDNAGFELVTDLCLADWLVSSGACAQVALRLKGHPTFVSDALAKDVIETIDALEAGAAGADGARAAARWREHVDAGRWLLDEDVYWAQPFAFWEMPEHVTAALEEAALVVLKGDANYRRLLGDRHWELSEPFATVGRAFGARAPLLALRTLKAELGCGIPEDQSARAAAADDQWLVSGKWGVIHFYHSDDD